MSQPTDSNAPLASTSHTIIVEKSSESAATLVPSITISTDSKDNAGSPVKLNSPTVNTVKNVVAAMSATTPTGAGTGKDNIIVVVNKMDGGASVGTSGEVKVMSKPLVIGSPGTPAILKKGSVMGMGNTIVKVQKASPQATASAAALGKRSIVVTSRPGVNQILACAPGLQQQHQQQPSHGSTPVILTQKVAAGGIVTSPVVSTGGVNSAIGNVLGGTKIVATTGASPQAQPQQRLQDVRVDNWGNYCLQRLQTMYDKGDYCDLTLRFHSSQEIKVHRVVVNLCTEYFSNLEKLYGLSEGTLILPKDVEFQTMQTIIKFFYTGKLEVRGTQFNDIYRTVKMMNITILIKLLEAHSKKPAPGAQAKKEAGRAVVLKQAVDLGKGQKGQVQIQVATGTGQTQPASPVIAVPGSKGLQVASPGVKLPPGVKTKTVLARVQPQNSKSGGSPAKSSTKKLPIWKERKFTPVTPDPPPQLEKWQIKEEEPARPTRFEWGDPDEPDPFMSSTLTNHALMEKQKERHSGRKAEDIFDTVKNQSQVQSGVKRTKPASEPSPEKSPSSEPPAPKVPRLDLQNSELVELPEPESNIEMDTNDEGVIDTSISSETITADDIPVATASSSTTSPAEKKPVPILKPALKPATKNAKSAADAKGKESTPTKTVRFAPEVEKENNEKPAATATTSATATATSPSVSNVNTSIVVTPTTSPKLEISYPSSDSSDALMNHSKLISEVLRKFPDLVKDNKNIKLKIVQKPADGASAGTSGKETKSKISYIVLKSTGGSDSSGSTVLKKSAAQSGVSKFWETDKTPKKPSPAENTTGPWLCETCGEGENSALQFDTYYNFRRHLVDVHSERIDARICEYCGQRASKRNLLLYHLYTKHGVQPPKNCTFPHCDRCDYVALSESLLNKHKQNHDVNKEFSCSICSASFKSSSALQSHMSANLHRNKDTKVYDCPYCRKPFVRNINLKAHIRSLHRDVARIEEMEDPRLPPDESLKIATGTSRRRQFPSILAAARSSTSSSMVEFVTAENFTDGQTVSYVTADGQPIEIIDPSALSSLPITLVSSGEDGLTAVGSPIGTTANMGIDGHSAAGATEYVTSVSQDSSQQAMYVMDGSQGAMEIDMSNVGLTLAPDGTMVYDGNDEQNFIVQDMQGNQYRRITGIDETGKPVAFLQMISENSQVEISPAILDESMAVDGTSANSQMYVSSGGMQIPVTSGADGQQVIFTTAGGDGTILEMVPSTSGPHQVVMSEAVLTAHGQQLDDQHQQHLQLVQHETTETVQEVIHDQMGQPVQELHLVLDQQENRTEEEVHHEVQHQQEEMEIVEVQQSESYDELQLEQSYQQGALQELEHTETVEQEQTEIVTGEVADTEQIEVDENSQQLQIDEESHSMGSMKLESDSLDIHNQETQNVNEENLEESIELVEGQTLTLIEEEDGTQTLKVGDSTVEEVS